MAKKVMGPGPKQSKPAVGSRTDSAGMQYFGKQVAAAMNAKKPATAKKTAPKKAAPATADTPKKAAAPATAKKPVSKRAPLMEVGVGNKGYRMSIDTTNMNKPDEQTYNFIMRDSTGKVTSKGNLSRAGGGAGIGKSAARQIVNKYKGKK